jgi:hypothetical protein
MAVLRGHLPADRFTTIANEWARDRRMHLKARGLLVYIASHAQGYRLSVAQMVAECADGKAAVYAALTELRDLGYLQVMQGRDDRGRLAEVDYLLVDPAETATAEGVDNPAEGANPQVSTASRKSETGGKSAASRFSASSFSASGKPASGKSDTKKTSSKKTSDKNTTAADAAGAPPDGGMFDVADRSLVVADDETPTTRRRRRTRLTEDWLPPAAAADEMAHELHIDRATLADWHRDFVDYWVGRGESMADWLATWRRWMRREGRDRADRAERQTRRGGSSDPALDVLRAEAAKGETGWAS